MIKKIAIEPAALKRWEDFRFVFAMLSFSQGRVLARFPKKWPKMLMDSLGDIGDIERKRFEVKLFKYKSDRMVSSGQPYDGSLEWVENIQERAASFDRIILRDFLAGNVNEVSAAPIELVDEEFFETEREIRTPSDVQGLTEPAALLIQETRGATLVDPYFRVTTMACLKVLGRLIEIAGEGGRCRAFSVYTSEDGRAKDEGHRSRLDLENLLRGKVKSPFSIDFFFKNTAPDLNSFHARYLLTEKGGLRYDKGFRSTTPAEKVDVSILDKIFHTQLCEIYPLPLIEKKAESDWRWQF
jgi:hypothetical protein